jgi:hypothetical protein
MKTFHLQKKMILLIAGFLCFDLSGKVQSALTNQNGLRLEASSDFFSKAGSAILKYRLIFPKIIYRDWI